MLRVSITGKNIVFSQCYTVSERLGSRIAWLPSGLLFDL